MQQTPLQRNRARQLRKSMTDAERLLWRELRNPENFSAKFRRPCPIGPYVVDFVCLEQRLIIEVDGSQHQQSDHDVQRTEWLEKNGFRVLRFWNNEVMQNRSAVCEVIWQSLGPVQS
ncbi:MAG: endonuclease domain-containing protein [Pseudomonadota bacterium]